MVNDALNGAEWVCCRYQEWNGRLVDGRNIESCRNDRSLVNLRNEISYLKLKAYIYQLTL